MFLLPLESSPGAMSPNARAFFLHHMLENISVFGPCSVPLALACHCSHPDPEQVWTSDLLFSKLLAPGNFWQSLTTAFTRLPSEICADSGSVIPKRQQCGWSVSSEQWSPGEHVLPPSAMMRGSDPCRSPGQTLLICFPSC